MDFRLDRTAFRMQMHEEEEATKVLKEATYAEPLAIATYLIRAAYRIPEDDEMRMDNTYFTMGTRN